ncbi:hypothetical protein [Deinococcus peraridilitoris]|uniref:Phosphonate metabolism protein n=1 Tax=Deinococcus peraridilitoris (strain DSM 19664 / LMG 22246 / CIP 109416 / KR-200) TaxID=937777 RepID=K9ZXR4_DEIPD|nr:hypothetical protein [Deinococcus peraridilitoris]AFZ66386.1 hypothetical protein Deipe_0811 [Deinococcus peraridilitoris DSM 19664]
MSDTPSPTRFAVYLVPNAEDAFYQLGSSALGYDMRAGRRVPQLPELRPEWVAKAGQYGFHLTVTEAFECDPASFAAIEKEIVALCACFSPHSLLRLSNGRMEVWDEGTVIVRRFDPNEALLVLHALLTARLAPFVTGSSFERMVQENPHKYPAPHERARLKLFHTPRGLDSWTPHFTLVEPYTGPDAGALAEDLEARFEPYPTLELDQVTLLSQKGEAPFEFVRDFRIGLR